MAQKATRPNPRGRLPLRERLFHPGEFLISGYVPPLCRRPYQTRGGFLVSFLSDECRADPRGAHGAGQHPVNRKPNLGAFPAVGVDDWRPQTRTPQFQARTLTKRRFSPVHASAIQRIRMHSPLVTITCVCAIEYLRRSLRWRWRSRCLHGNPGMRCQSQQRPLGLSPQNHPNRLPSFRRFPSRTSSPLK
jgi:hypothetical protein